MWTCCVYMTYTNPSSPSPLTGFGQWVSPVITPTPPVVGAGDWANAVARPKKFVSGLTLEEKINVTTGLDIGGLCVANTTTIPRLNWNDTVLIEKAMGAEFRGEGVNVALGSMTNMAAAGRNWEGFGADPFLSGVATAATINGIQSNGVIATVKHFIVIEQEHFRGGSEASQIYSSNIGDQTLHELYLWPFAEAVHAGVGAVMCAHNKINQTQACQNSKIIKLEFVGFIMSDWAAMIDGVQPALVGLDMNMPGFFAYDRKHPDTATNGWWGANLIEMVKNGSVPEARVDDMVVRTFTAYYKLGQDKGYPEISLKDAVNCGALADHYKLIQQIGAASTVLLKNTNKALPLTVKNIKRIAIVGSDAGPNPDGANGCSDRGCSQGTMAMGSGSGVHRELPLPHRPLAAITTHIQSMNPTVVIDAVFNDFNLAPVRVGSLADTCLVFVSPDSSEGYINVGGNQGVRNTITLWHGGDTLVLATASSSANTIVVQHTVGPVTMPVLYAGNITPHFEFGFGLSYTTFGYSGLTIAKTHHRRDTNAVAPRPPAPPPPAPPPSANSAAPPCSLSVSFRVQNTAPPAGNEVLQLYLTFPAGSGEPPKVLRGFARNLLQRGQSKVVSIPLRLKVGSSSRTR
ncbi:glycoside hydrolase superfamily [Mycena vulgaris]|nr:glycoside hydrolase superfamily [Mycena vulgaris]